jgi:hypothetical protein
MNANERFLNEAKEIDLLESISYQESLKQFSRRTTAADLECHRMPGQAVCEDCEEYASFSRRTKKPNSRGNFISYYCSVHAPEDAGCFVVKEARHKFK